MYNWLTVNNNVLPIVHSEDRVCAGKLFICIIIVPAGTLTILYIDGLNVLFSVLLLC